MVEEEEQVAELPLPKPLGRRGTRLMMHSGTIKLSKNQSDRLKGGKAYVEVKRRRLSRMQTFESPKQNPSSTLNFEQAYVYKAIFDELEKS